MRSPSFRPTPPPPPDSDEATGRQSRESGTSRRGADARPRTTDGAHARSGDPVAHYLGDTDAFDRSITDFSTRYADQNEQDFAEFVRAVESGRLEAVEGL
jgi:hypothetical protein